MRTGTIATFAAVLLLSLHAAVSAESLKAHIDGDALHMEAADFHFLSAEARQRLHDGATVVYAFHVYISSTRNGDASVTVFYHCVFSYDIFEEKYKVSRLEPGYRSASHLSESAARDLCLDSLIIPAGSLGRNVPFWISMEYRMEDPQSPGPGESRSLLDTLVDIFSQRNKAPQPADTLRGGPFRLDDLRKSK